MYGLSEENRQTTSQEIYQNASELLATIYPHKLYQQPRVSCKENTSYRLAFVLTNLCVSGFFSVSVVFMCRFSAEPCHVR